MPRLCQKNGVSYVFGNATQSSRRNNTSSYEERCVPTKHDKFNLDWYLQCEAEKAGFKNIKEYIKSQKK